MYLRDVVMLFLPISPEALPRGTVGTKTPVKRVFFVV